MISTRVKKKPSNATSIVEKKMKKIQKKKAERIKEKLSGKNYSPIVAKAKSSNATPKKKVSNKPPASTVKKPSAKVLEAETLKASKEKSKPLGSLEVKSKPRSLMKKNEKEVTKESLKRKPDVASTGTSNKKTKIDTSSSIAPKKGKPNSISSKRTLSRVQKPSLQSQGVSKTNTNAPATTKKSEPQNTTLVSVLGTSGKAIKVQKKKKLVPAIKKAPAVDDRKSSLRSADIEVPKVDPGSLPEAESPIEKKSTKKATKKKNSNSNANLKPISNIKTLKKNPSPSTLKAKALRRKKAAAKFPERGVCYFSHLPHGFYEKELKAYCSQFGKVTGVYHPVSKGGNSRGFAFVEFLHKDVAEVVADTMNNYLMFNRLLKCKLVPCDEQRPWVFKHKTSMLKIRNEKRQRAIKLRNRPLSKEEEEKFKERKVGKVKALHKKLAALGVDYQFQVNNGTDEQNEKASSEN